MLEMNMPKSREHVVGIFRHPPDAERAVTMLVQSGIDRKEIGLIMPGDEKREGVRQKIIHKEHEAHTEKGGEAGASVGAVLGGAATLLTDLALVAIPGMGPLFVAGPIAAMLIGAITGGAVGGFAGAIAGTGISEVEARTYEQQIRLRHIVVIVWCNGRCRRAQAVLRDAGAMKLANGL